MKKLFWYSTIAIAVVSSSLAYWGFNSYSGFSSAIQTNYSVLPGNGGAQTSYPALSIGAGNNVGSNSMAVGYGVSAGSNSIAVGSSFTVTSAQNGKSPFKVTSSQVIIPAGSCLIIDTPRGGIPNFVPLTQ